MPLGCWWTGETRLNAGSVCMWRCFLVAKGGVLPDRWPADTPTPRGEGAGLSAPAAAAKKEQLAQHCESRYQFGAPRGTRGAPPWPERRDIGWRHRARKGWL